jgi:ATP-dependent Lon protease
VLGAHRAGITTIILPKDNEADIEDVPEEARKTLTFHPVETLDEVLQLALEPEPARSKQSEKKTAAPQAVGA